MYSPTFWIKLPLNSLPCILGKIILSWHFYKCQGRCTLSPFPLLFLLLTYPSSLSLYVRYLREYQSLGTAGGLYHFRDEILRGNPDQFFVMHVDIACAFPLNEMMAAHMKHRGICTMLGTKVNEKKKQLDLDRRQKESGQGDKRVVYMYKHHVSIFFG